MVKQKTLNEIIKEVEKEMPEIIRAEINAEEEKENGIFEIYDRVFSLRDMRMYTHKIIDKLKENKLLNRKLE